VKKASRHGRIKGYRVGPSSDCTGTEGATSACELGGEILSGRTLKEHVLLSVSLMEKTK
jgi:hypothetical protein